MDPNLRIPDPNAAKNSALFQAIDAQTLTRVSFICLSYVQFAVVDVLSVVGRSEGARARKLAMAQWSVSCQVWESQVYLCRLHATGNDVAHGL